ncbi:MAG: nucleoside triphosphate pyrophosphohydrolase [Reyranellaceae bacterium]
MSKVPPPDPRRPGIDRLREVMMRLRDRDNGCPWDLEQDFASIAPYTIEEAYEVADAIERRDMAALKEELGDLLLQVVYHAQMASERTPAEGSFDFEAVAQGIADKMVSRHPHVFGDGRTDTADLQTRNWEKFKAAERAAKAQRSGQAGSVLDGVALALPALMRAEKLQQRAARVGFEWSDVLLVFDKIAEEVGELRAEVEGARDPARLTDEIGDVLFVMANLARQLGIDPEVALRHANAKFERRFGHVEKRLRETGRPIEQASLDDMEALWQEAKRLERQGG